MKKLLLIVSVAVLALTLAGCKPKAEEVVCTNDAANGTLYEFDKNQTEITEIKVWLDDEDYANALIEAFETANPTIKVKLELVGAVDTRQRLETYADSQYAADVVVFPHDHIGAALNSNLLYPFPQSQRSNLESRMVGSAINTATSCYDSVNNMSVACDGTTYPSELFGAPLSGESVALFYNKTLLNELNGTDAPEATWEEIIASAMAYNQLDDPLTTENDALTYFRLDVGNAYDMHFAATAFGFDLFGPDHLDKDNANLGGAEMTAALTWLNSSLRPAVNDYQSASLNGDANREAFESGKVAYIIDGPWSIARYKAAAIDNNETPDDTSDDVTLFDWGVTKIPTIGGVQPITFSGVQIAAVYKGTTEPTAAFKFVEFMTSNEGLAIMYAETTKLPALKDVSVVAGVASDPYLSGIASQLAFSHPMPIIKEMGYFWSEAGGMYSSAWNGTKTPAAAATDAQTGFDANLD